MRWLLLFLVVLNVAFYLHQISRVPVTAPVLIPEMSQPEPGIRLLAEAAPPVRRVETQQSHDSCFILGGFDEESEALSVKQRLISLDIASNVEAVDMSAGVDYWVYLPPLVSRQASLRELRELQSMDVDSYIITVGELTNGISLGIFSRRDSAESVVGYMHRADYDAQIKELPRTHRRYWVRLAQESYPLFNSEVLEGLLRDFPAIMHQQIPCASIASDR